MLTCLLLVTTSIISLSQAKPVDTPLKLELRFLPSAEDSGENVPTPDVNLPSSPQQMAFKSITLPENHEDSQKEKCLELVKEKESMLNKREIELMKKENYLLSREVQLLKLENGPNISAPVSAPAGALKSATIDDALETTMGLETTTELSDVSSSVTPYTEVDTDASTTTAGSTDYYGGNVDGDSRYDDGSDEGQGGGLSRSESSSKQISSPRREQGDMTNLDPTDILHSEHTMHSKEVVLLKKENELHLREIKLLKMEKELLMKDLGKDSEDEDRGLDDNDETTVRNHENGVLEKSSEGTTPGGTSDDETTKSYSNEATTTPAATSDDDSASSNGSDFSWLNLNNKTSEEEV